MGDPATPVWEVAAMASFTTPVCTGPVGVTDTGIHDGSLVPIALVAVTATVYEVPFVRPVIVQLNVVVMQELPSEAVAV